MKKLIKFHDYAQRKKIDLSTLSSDQILNICLSVGCEIPTELILQKKEVELKKPEEEKMQTLDSELEVFEVVVLSSEEVPQIAPEELKVVESETESVELENDSEVLSEVDLSLEENVQEQKSSILRKKRNQNKLQQII